MNEKTIELKQALRTLRQRGSTTYLLKSAIEMPKVTIIVANQTQAKDLEHQYKKMLSSLPWWKKLLRKMKGLEGTPSFVSVRNSKEILSLSAKKTPVILDLYAVASSL